ncbi:nucleotidyltransferase family protein [Desulfococcus sp.]|uniref:nucleotidyltransferase family protein n=1 Tax=Desulfococcus sp. TaxID=2025834 RepID=UPI0035936AF0
MTKSRIAIPKEQLARFCRTHGIQRLSLFGSVLSDEFGPDSDVDVLVEFRPGTRIGLIRLTRLEFELGEILGRKVDLNTPGFISKYFRSRVMAEREVQYAEA